MTHSCPTRRSSDLLYASAKALGLSEGPYRVFGDERTHGSAGATFLNAALAHSLDFDDTHAASTLHPGAPVIPAAIIAGEMAGASGADRSEEHTSELQSLLRNSYDVLCLKKK